MQKKFTWTQTIKCFKKKQVVGKRIRKIPGADKEAKVP